MGMFDSVYLDCPECGDYVEFQSKAGDCELHRYYKGDGVPMDVAADILGQSRRCKNPECGGLAMAVPDVPKQPLIFMKGVQHED